LVEVIACPCKLLRSDYKQRINKNTQSLSLPLKSQYRDVNSAPKSLFNVLSLYSQGHLPLSPPRPHISSDSSLTSQAFFPSLSKNPAPPPCEPPPSRSAAALSTAAQRLRRHPLLISGSAALPPSSGYGTSWAWRRAIVPAPPVPRPCWVGRSRGRAAANCELRSSAFTGSRSPRHPRDQAPPTH
jgi:hypothetical protein